MRRNRYEQIEHITPCQCEDCGGEPVGWDESWSYCPYHGSELVSMADLEEMYDQQYADDRRDVDAFAQQIFDAGKLMNRVAKMGVKRW